MNKLDYLTIAVDFDGTIIKGHQYPNAITAQPYAIECLKKLQDSPRVKLILWSCRDINSDKDAYNKMIKFIDSKDLHFDAINDNLDDYKKLGFKCRKIFANLYIDDSCNDFVEEGDQIMIDFWRSLYNRIYNPISLNQWIDERLALI